MQPCLNSTIAEGHTVAEYVRFAQRTGYHFVDGDISKIAQMDWAEAEALFDECQVELASFGLPVNVYGEEGEFRRHLKELPALARTAMGLGAKSCCTWLWPSIDELPVPYAARLAWRFRECARVLASFGIRLGLEFVGPHHLRNKKYPFVYTLQDTLDYIRGIGAQNIGLLLDSYHWYCTGGTVAELAALPAEMIVHVHVNDANQPPELALDGERQLPGDGIINLAGFFHGLHEARYAGPVAIEVLHKAPFADPMEAVAMRARVAVERLIAGNW